MSIQTNERVIAQYLSAWSNHDVDLLRQIFDDSSTYEIRGKRTLNGLSEITAYWERNSRRQRDLRLHHAVDGASGAGTARVLFCATFADIEEREKQTVYGQMSFDIDNGRIRAFSENYGMVRVPVSLPQSLGARALSHLWSMFWMVKGFGAQLGEYLLVSASNILVVLMAVVLGYSAFSLSNLPDWLLCGLTFAPSECGVISPDRKQQLINIASRNLSTFTSVFVFAVVILYWLRYKIRTPISLIPLQAENHDLTEMKKRFHGARELTIFAGDFSFVGSDQELRDIFYRLNSTKDLVLVSEKSEAEVRKGFGSEPDAISLFEDLKRERRIYFDRGVPIRCSILRRWNRSEILYRYRGGGADSFNELNLCILKGRKEAGPVLELVEKLATKVAS